jgi:preprotein translocase subunit SecE
VLHQAVELFECTQEKVEQGMSTSEASQQANRAQMDASRLVVIAYLLFGVIIGVFLSKIIELGAAQAGFTTSTAVIAGTPITWPDVIGFALAIGLGVYCWMSDRVRTLSTEVAEELTRVSWPSFEETRVSTIAVIVASLVAAVILFAMDTLSLKLMVDWIPVLWGKL